MRVSAKHADMIDEMFAPGSFDLAEFVENSFASHKYSKPLPIGGNKEVRCVASRSIIDECLECRRCCRSFVDELLQEFVIAGGSWKRFV